MTARSSEQSCIYAFFFFNDTATTEIYTLSLHDALPISPHPVGTGRAQPFGESTRQDRFRSEEHTSELQSRFDLVCRLLLEKKHETLGPGAYCRTIHELCILETLV